MKITRQNYEHWFIDFIEGNLNPNDGALVREFVQINPDLNSELEDFLSCKVVPAQTTFPNKDLLKQNPTKAINEITKFERLSIAYLENELTGNEQVELNRLLINSDKKKKEFQLIQKTKLSADNNVVFNSKSELKKLFVVKRKMRNYKVIYRVAAVFILLMSLTFFLYQNSRTNLTGKQLTKINTYPELRKVVQNKETVIITIKDHLSVTTLQDQIKKQEDRQKILIPEELVAHKCLKIDRKNTHVYSGQLLSGINKNTYAFNKMPKKEEILFESKVKNKINATGKYLFVEVKAFVKKKLSYKKSYTDNGRMLIAFNIGDYQYKIDKKQKN